MKINCLSNLAPSLALVLAANASSAMAEVADAKGKMNLTVLPVGAPINFPSMYTWQSISEASTEKLRMALHAGGFTVRVSEADLSSLKQDQVLVLSGDVKAAIEFGKRKGTTHILTGRIRVIDNFDDGFLGIEYTTAIEMDVRLIDAEQGSYAWTKDAVVGRAKYKRPIFGRNRKWEGLLEKALDQVAKQVVTELAKFELPANANAPSGRASDAPPSRSEGEATLSSTAKALRYAVAIPEVHLVRRMPDPAGEQEVQRIMLGQGAKLYDAKFSALIRDEAWLREVLKNDKSPVELFDLKTKKGIDVLITGEAVSDRAESNRAGEGIVVCRGRIELKAIRTDTGQLIGSVHRQAPGQDISEFMASKTAIKEAAAQAMPELMGQINKALEGAAIAGGRASQAIDVQISGMSYSGGAQVAKSLMSVPGVLKAERRSFEGGTATLEVHIDPSKIDDLAMILESDSRLRSFGLKIEKVESGKIMVSASPVRNPPAPKSPRPKPGKTS